VRSASAFARDLCRWRLPFCESKECGFVDRIFARNLDVLTKYGERILYWRRTLVVFWDLSLSLAVTVYICKMWDEISSWF